MAAIQVPDIIRFRNGLNLYDYQIESVNQIIDAERALTFHGVHGRIPLTEPFGSGKTFIVLALIMKNPIPPIQPCYLMRRTDLPPYAVIIPSNVSNQIIRPTAIVVARSVYAQWVRNLTNYTSLRFFEAKDKPATLKLIEMIMNGEINDYDVVLVKYGQTHDLDVVLELCLLINQKTLPLIWSRVIYDDVDLIAESSCMRAISSIFVTGATDFTYNYCWAEDLDRRRYEKNKGQFVAKDVFTRLPNVRHIFSNGRNFSASIWATLGHDPVAIARDHGVFAIRWLLGSITNTEIHHAANLIEGIEAVDCSELLRMIHGDAMISAARSLQISVVTPRAMFASVLGTQREAYETARARLMVLEKIKSFPLDARIENHKQLREFVEQNHVEDESDASDESDESDESDTSDESSSLESEPLQRQAPDGASSSSQAQSSEIPSMPNSLKNRKYALIEQCGLDSRVARIAERRIRVVEGSFRVITLLGANSEDIDAEIEKIRAFIARIDRSFERIRENLTEQVCSICYTALGENHVAIMRCCGFVICTTCCSRSSQFDRSANGRIVGRCAQCRQLIDIARDIIIIESGINIGDLVQKTLDERKHEGPFLIEPAAPQEATAADQGAAAAHITRKIDYAIALITGTIRAPYVSRPNDTLHVRQMDVPAIRGLMNGTQMVLPPDNARRFLICTSFDETIDDIAFAFDEHEIRYDTLHGTIHEFAVVLDRFTRGEVRVLIINVRALYAGVDLQCATDLIIVAHGQQIENIGQIVGRAQRLGRLCSLTVHSLEYVAADGTPINLRKRT